MRGQLFGTAILSTSLLNCSYTLCLPTAHSHLTDHGTVGSGTLPWATDHATVDSGTLPWATDHGTVDSGTLPWATDHATVGSGTMLSQSTQRMPR